MATTATGGAARTVTPRTTTPRKRTVATRAEDIRSHVSWFVWWVGAIVLALIFLGIGRFTVGTTRTQTITIPQPAPIAQPERPARHRSEPLSQRADDFWEERAQRALEK